MSQLQQQHAMMANQSRLNEYYSMLKFNMEQERLKKAQIEQQEKLQQFHQKMLINSMLQRSNPMVRFYNFDLKSLTLIKLALQRRNEEVGQYNCSVCCMSFVTLRELEVNSFSGAIFDVYETKSFYVRQSCSHIFLSLSRCLIYLGSLFKFSCAYFVHNDFI